MQDVCANAACSYYPLVLYTIILVYGKVPIVDQTFLSHNLRRLRDEKGLSQADVAERAGGIA